MKRVLKRKVRRAGARAFSAPVEHSRLRDLMAQIEDAIAAKDPVVGPGAPNTGVNRA
jgi:hypothetical protein